MNLPAVTAVSGECCGIHSCCAREDARSVTAILEGAARADVQGDCRTLVGARSGSGSPGPSLIG